MSTTSKGFQKEKSSKNESKKTSPIRRLRSDFKEIKTGLRLRSNISYQKISGPISVDYYETINGKHGIFFFGDNHAPATNMCDESKDSTLYPCLHICKM